MTRPVGDDVGHRIVFGEADGVPHRQDVEAAAELQPLGLRRKPQPGLDQVRDDLVALALEMVLGHPQDVEAEFVHRLGDVLGGREHLAQPLVGIAPVVRRRAGKPDVVELDLADIEHVEFADHALRPRQAAGASLTHKLWENQRARRLTGRSRRGIPAPGRRWEAPGCGFRHGQFSPNIPLPPGGISRKETVICAIRSREGALNNAAAAGCGDGCRFLEWEQLPWRGSLASEFPALSLDYTIISNPAAVDGGVDHTIASKINNHGEVGLLPAPGRHPLTASICTTASSSTSPLPSWMPPRCLASTTRAIWPEWVSPGCSACCFRLLRGYFPSAHNSRRFPVRRAGHQQCSRRRRRFPGRDRNPRLCL